MAHARTMRIPVERQHPTPLAPAATATPAHLPGLLDRWWHTSTPRTFDMVVSPDVALVLLETVTARNRPTRQNWINELADHLRAGTFHPPEKQLDCVGFDVNGRNCNGQHRLWAVAESGISAAFTIKVGVPEDAVEHVDNHLPRSDAEQYAISRGIETSTKFIAIVKRLVSAGARPATWNRAAKFAAVDKYREIVERALVIIGPRNQKIKGLLAACVIAVIARASTTAKVERLRRFFDVLESGITTEAPGEATIILLRDWMQRNGASSQALQTELYWKTERALAAFLHGDQLTSLYAASAELFPLPGEVVEHSRVMEAARVQRRVARHIGKRQLSA